MDKLDSIRFPLFNFPVLVIGESEKNWFYRDTILYRKTILN